MRGNYPNLKGRIEVTDEEESTSKILLDNYKDRFELEEIIRNNKAKEKRKEVPKPHEEMKLDYSDLEREDLKTLLTTLNTEKISKSSQKSKNFHDSDGEEAESESFDIIERKTNRSYQSESE